MAEEKKPLSRSEREAKIKDKAGWVITVIAALLAVNTYIANGNSSKVLNNTIKANDTWAFYQAKSIKQTLAEMAMDDAIESVASELRSVAMMVFVRQGFVFSAGDTTGYALRHRLDGGVALLTYSLAEATT